MELADTLVLETNALTGVRVRISGSLPNTWPRGGMAYAVGLNPTPARVESSNLSVGYQIQRFGEYSGQNKLSRDGTR